MVTGFLVIFTCFLCTGSGNSSGSGDPNVPTHQNITAETAYQMMQKSTNYILLDVRTEPEFREKHIGGAVLIPDFELEKRAASELPDKNAVILVYCRSGVRSANAAKALAEKGYTKVFNFGGIIHWPYETVSGN